MVVASLRFLALPLVFLAATATGPAPRVDEQGAWVQPFQKANTKSVDARLPGIDHALRDSHASPFAPAATVRLELHAPDASPIARSSTESRAAAAVLLHAARAPPTLS
jgi:hypothetical protein